MSREAVASARDLTRVFGQGELAVKALDRVDVEFHAGQLYGVFGPSGCGKTTLLIMLGLLDRPSSGAVLFGGENARMTLHSEREVRDFRRKRIGFVFQKANLIPFLTAIENVALALIIDGVHAAQARARAAELLAGLDMGDRLHHYPSQLSGGEQQRVAVARALANNPDLILADEPTAALDSTRGRQVMELLRRVSREWNASVAVVTHDPRATEFFDWIFEMADGRIVEKRAGAGVCDHENTMHKA